MTILAVKGDKHNKVVAGLIAAIVVSLIDKKPSEEVLKIYETATDKSIDD